VESVVQATLDPVVVADFNRDGAPDLAAGMLTVAPQQPTRVTSLVILGNGGTGHFQAVSSTVLANPIVADGSSKLLIVADFNGDQNPDIAIRSNPIAVLLGKGDGTLVQQNSVAVGVQLLTMLVGDFNGDGRQDLITRTAEIFFFAGIGDGTFQAPKLTPTSDIAHGLTAADFNGDGSSTLPLPGLSCLAMGMAASNHLSPTRTEKTPPSRCRQILTGTERLT
jgi:FG-GAP-like repeat